MPDLNAFVLMPFGPDYDPVFERLIKPSLSELGFSVSRADLSTNQQQILKDIVNSLADADLVIVDVTGLNGNVMYELGLAHAMGRRTVMITRDIGELPFDLRSYRATEYSTEFHEADQLKDRLKRIAEGVIDGSAEFSNPVLDFAPRFIGREEQVSAAPIKSDSEHGPSSIEESTTQPGPEPDLGLLDYSIQLADSNERLTALAGKIADATRKIGAQVQARTKQIEQTNKNLGPKAAPVLRQLMRETADEFDEFSAELEETNPLLEQELRSVASSANGIARLRVGSSSDDQDQLRRDIAAFEQAEVQFGEALDSVVSFADTLTKLPKLEQKLIAAAKRSSLAVNSTASAIELGRSEFGRVRGLLQERLSGN